MKNIINFLISYVTGFNWFLILWLGIFTYALNPIFCCFSLPLVLIWDLVTEYQLYAQIHQITSMAKGQFILKQKSENSQFSPRTSQMRNMTIRDESLEKIKLFIKSNENLIFNVSMGMVRTGFEFRQGNRTLVLSWNDFDVDEPNLDYEYAFGDNIQQMRNTVIKAIESVTPNYTETTDARTMGLINR